MSTSGRPSTKGLSEHGGAQVYVYYRVRRADAAAAIAAVRGSHAHLRALLPGLACSLSQRVDDGADPLTLMETYAHADGVTDKLQRDIESQMQHALAAWIVGERHVEVFQAPG